jgi:DNA-binding transcriptional MerR regulator
LGFQKGKQGMARKRNVYTRARDRSQRPKTPAPSNGWVLAELAEFSGLSVTTLRYYVQQRLLRPLEFRGTLTRYARRELLRLLGIQRLQSEGRAPLAAIRQQLDALTDSELEAWLVQRPLSEAVAAALGILPPAMQTPSATEVNPEAKTGAAEPELGSGWVETWQRVALLPGLELVLRVDAPSAVRAAAQRICQEYGR